MAHWTQTPAGKKKMAASMRKMWKRRKNGHAVSDIEAGIKEAKKRGVQTRHKLDQLRKKMGMDKVTKTTKSVTRDQMVELAKEGARQRLKVIEREATSLRMFLGDDLPMSRLK